MKLYEEYLTDEELMELINEVEANELVEAPEYLTDNIMDAIRHQDDTATNITSVNRVKDSELEPQKKPPRDKKKELLTYGFKVMLSAAASIAILLAVPMAGNNMNQDQQINQESVVKESKSREGSKPITEALSNFNKKSNDVFKFFNESTTTLF